MAELSTFLTNNGGFGSSIFLCDVFSRSISSSRALQGIVTKVDIFYTAPMDGGHGDSATKFKRTIQETAVNRFAIIAFIETLKKRKNKGIEMTNKRQQITQNAGNLKQKIRWFGTLSGAK